MRLAFATCLAGAALIAAGCGSDGAGETPIVCLGGPGAYLEALRDAPAEVRLGGETPISDCFPKEQSAGDISNVGQTVVGVATELNRRGRKDPAGGSPIELGYLVGAVERGTMVSGGIHQDLVRRLESAARFAPDGGLDNDFQQGFAQGFAAGQRDG